MTKKKQTNKAVFTKLNLTLTIAIVSLVMGLASFLWANIAWDAHLRSQESLAEQIFELSHRNVMQDHCIEYGIKPCTQEMINANRE